MPLDLSITMDHDTKNAVLSVLGEVDIATVGDLESEIASLEGVGYGLVVDLTSTEFMDSTGIRLLMASHESYRQEGRSLKVAVGGGPIHRLLEVTGVLTHLETYPSVSQALAG